jgi:predicted ester cyclase
MNEGTKATAVRFFEEQDRLRGGPADDLCADGYVAYLAGAAALDLEGHKAFAATFYAAIPDLEHKVQEVIAEGDRVAVRFRLTGTNSGSFMGRAPSGKPIDAGALALMTTSNGRVTEIHAEFDQLGLMQQIGALPSEPTAVGH